jgi:L-fuconate dehydratase
VVKGGRYQTPRAPGTSITMKAASLAEHTYPHGAVWQKILSKK